MVLVEGGGGEPVVLLGGPFLTLLAPMWSTGCQVGRSSPPHSSVLLIHYLTFTPVAEHCFTVGGLLLLYMYIPCRVAVE